MVINKKNNIVLFIVNIFCLKKCQKYLSSKYKAKNNARNLANLQIEEGKSIGKFFTKVQILINFRTNMGKQLMSFDNFVTNILGLKDMPSFEDLPDWLKLRETRRNNKSRQVDEEDLVV